MRSRGDLCVSVILNTAYSLKLHLLFVSNHREHREPVTVLTAREANVYLFLRQPEWSDGRTRGHG